MWNYCLNFTFLARRFNCKLWNYTTLCIKANIWNQMSLRIKANIWHKQVYIWKAKCRRTCPSKDPSNARDRKRVVEWQVKKVNRSLFIYKGRRFIHFKAHFTCHVHLLKFPRLHILLYLCVLWPRNNISDVALSLHVVHFINNPRVFRCFCRDSITCLVLGTSVYLILKIKSREKIILII